MTWEVAPFAGTAFWSALALFVIGHAILARYAAARITRSLFMIAVSFALVFVAQSGDGEAAALLMLVLALTGVVFPAAHSARKWMNLKLKYETPSRYR